MSDKLKSSYYHKVISNVPKVSEFSDEYIANLILNKSAQDYTSLSDTETSKPGERINQVFLRNTLKSIQAHNVREEIDDSWRKHTLQKSTLKMSGVKRLVSTDGTNDADLREEWSKRKLLKMSSKDNLDKVNHSDMQLNHSTISSDIDNIKQRKKEKKTKKTKKTKKKKKSKTKHKEKDHDS